MKISIFFVALIIGTSHAGALSSLYTGKSYEIKKYKEKEYRFEYSPDASDRVIERNKLMGIINESHLLITQVSKFIKDRQQCISQKLQSPEEQDSCLRNLYEIQGTLKATVEGIQSLRSRLPGLKEIPLPLTEGFSKNLDAFEKGIMAISVSIEQSIEAASAHMKDALARNLQAHQEKWKNEGTNRAFCALLKDTTNLSRSWLLVAYRSAGMNDTYGIHEAYLKLSEARARAETGYKVCGFTPDPVYEDMEKNFTELKTLHDQQNPDLNLKRACASPKIQKWRQLKTLCLNPQSSDEFLFTLHNALVGRYGEEN